MRSHRSNAGKPVSEEWHRRRTEARRHSFHATEWSRKERARFNLDGIEEGDEDLFGRPNPYPGRITGAENPLTYENTGHDYTRTREDLREEPEN